MVNKVDSSSCAKELHTALHCILSSYCFRVPALSGTTNFQNTRVCYTTASLGHLPKVEAATPVHRGSGGGGGLHPECDPLQRKQQWGVE